MFACARIVRSVALYERTEDGLTRCTEHGHTFDALGSCPDCVFGEDSAATPERPSEHEATADEQLCRTIRDEILELARSYKEQREENDSKDRIGFSTVAKLYDCALKWHRAATEERTKRGDKDFAAWLVEEKRRLLNRGAAH